MSDTLVRNGDFDGFDNSNTGFVAGETVRTVGGDNPNSTATIEHVLESTGHYVIKIEGVERLSVVDFRDIEPLVKPQALPDFGMSSAQLAEYVSEAITRATGRILGVGKDQYDLGSAQKFETMPIGELYEATLEELDDVIVYAVMQQIRIRRMLSEIQKRGV